MMPLYQLTNNYQDAFELLGNDELPEEAVLQTIEAIEGELNLKMQNVSAFFLNLEAQADAVAEAAKKMAEREKFMRRRIEALKTYLLRNMEKCGISEISCPQFTVKLGKNPPSVVVDEAEQIPEIYFNAKVVKTLDKSAVKKAIQDGEEIPGCHLESAKRLIIK